MVSQIPSQNSKRNLESDHEVLQPLEELDRILNNMVAEIVKKGDVNVADKAHIILREVYLREPGAHGFSTHDLKIFLSDEWRSKYRTVVSCSSVGNILSPGKIICHNSDNDRSFEISNDYLPNIRNVIDSLLYTIYWKVYWKVGDPGISPYEKKSRMPSSLSQIYANINLTKEQGNPTIEIHENPYCPDKGMIIYKNERSRIVVHYTFL
ncbi:MAG: hypothetical protein GU343_02505 [Nanoarchaeota archaeon]|jgi:hypothetical protein|nr:hypothetical protein [Nanoarchaeota archaeon]